MAQRSVKRAPAWLRRTWRGALVGVLALALGIAAIVVPGLKVADLQLHEGTVYAVKQDSALLGTVNTQIKDLSLATRLADRSFDILQDRGTVIVKGESTSQVQAYDPSTGQLGGAVALPPAGAIVLKGGKVAVISRVNGSVWYGDADTMLSLDYSKEKAQLDLGENALVTLTTTGELIGLSLTRSEVVRLSGGQPVASKLPMELDPIVANVELSAIGDQAVVLDRTKQVVWFEGAPKPIEVTSGSKARLAAPGPQTGHLDGKVGALLATPTGLVGVSTKQVQRLTEAMPEGEVLQPVVVGSCVYAVVGTKLATSCAGQASSVVDIPEVPTDPRLSLRTNRDTVILNDARTGTIWLVNDGMRRITNWEKVTTSDAKTKQDQPDEEITKVNPDRSGPNRPPTARDDQLTAREGRTTVLPVLDNDSDPDGDVLTIAAPETAGPNTTLSPVRGGAGLQVTIDAGASGTRSFTYKISDGRGGEAQARVSLTIAPADQKAGNQPPLLFRKDPVRVAMGHQTQVRVLLDWRDPEGDDLILKNATMVDGDDEVSFTPDGNLTFTDVNKKPGLKQVAVEVSDGVSSSTGLLLVDARKAADVPPIANGDYYTAATGAEIEVKPLINDVGTGLALANVDKPVPASAKFSVDYSSRSFRFRADHPGTYYVGYKVTNGPSSFGLVRIDVADRAQQNRPPILGRDVAVLTHGGSVTIDPLLNDEDPDGDVLVVQTYTTAGLEVDMTDRHLMTIKEVTALKDPVTLSYQVSDGYNPPVTGTIVVIPTNPIGEVRPVANAEDVNVRAGDAVSINPLLNDYSPVGLDLHLQPTLIDNPGQAWVDGNQVRFMAPPVPGRITATYEVKDSLGRTASAQVRFNVISPDMANQAPIPSLVTGRVIAGTTARIQIPLSNIDPNGDSVRLVGLAQGPRLGRVVSVGPRYLEYEAFGKMRGTDSFTYVVTDGFGARGIGEIRVGVVPASLVGTAPTAVEDTIETRPGRTAYLNPLANDYDVDGDKISFAADHPLDFLIPANIADGSALTVQVPNTEGQWIGRYTIQDTRGALSSGNVRVVSDSKAPLLAPKATDDLVDVRQVFQRDSVDVPVLANDYDPDGPKSELTLSVPPYDTQGAAAAEVVKDGNDPPKLRVPIGDRLRVLRYQITDADGLSAYGFVIVPGKADAVPTLKDPNVVLTVTAGEQLKIPVAEYVQGTQGRSVRVSSADKVTGAPGTGLRLSPAEIGYRPALTDVGPAAVTFEVIEDLDASATDARVATVTIPIKVTPPPEVKNPDDPAAKDNQLNEPPTAPLIEVKVGAGEPQVLQNLAAFVTDPQGDDFTFRDFTGTIPAGLHVQFNGSMITASADLTVIQGAKATMTGKVVDARGAEGTVVVDVVAVPTTRPRTSVTDDNVPDANQGQPVTVPVLANDISSLDDPKLTVIATAIELGEGEVSFSPDSVTVKPGATFVGTMTVRYTVQDATLDPGRNVDGRIVLNVRGVPSTPGTPRQVSVGDSTLTVEWSSSLDNGLPLQGYVMTSHGDNGSSVETQCPTTTCTATGLTNGVTYTVSVIAKNQLGPSPASPESAGMMPNVKPDKMDPPVVKRTPGRAGKSLTITWNPAPNRGTPVTDYTITMVQGGAGTKTAKATDSSVVWDGLSNGTTYGFTITATNAAGTSDPSDSSAGVPSDPPDSPTNVTAVDSGAKDGGTITVSWTGSGNNNGSTITSYEVYVKTSNSFSIDDSSSASVAENKTTVDVTGLDNGTTYYVAVRAKNEAGVSDPAGVSASVTPFGTQSANAPKATALDKQVTLTADAVNPQGSTLTWNVKANSSNSSESFELTGIAATSANGLSTTVNIPQANSYQRSWTFQVAPVLTKNNNVKTGNYSSNSNSVTPFGAPGAPTFTFTSATDMVSATTYTGKFSAAVGTDNGNNPSNLQVVYSTDGGTTWKTASGTSFDISPLPITGQTVLARTTVKNSSLVSANTSVSAPTLLTATFTATTVTITAGPTPDASLTCTTDKTGPSASVSVARSGSGTITSSTPTVPLAAPIVVSCKAGSNNYQITI